MRLVKLHAVDIEELLMNSFVAIQAQLTTRQRIPQVPAPKKTVSRKIAPTKALRRGVGVSRLRVKLSSAPLPDFVEPMKAQLVDSTRPGDWIYEIKFDGYRALALRGGSETRVLSRNQKDLGKKFPQVADSISALDVQEAVIDGEIAAL